MIPDGEPRYRLIVESKTGGAGVSPIHNLEKFFILLSHTKIPEGRTLEIASPHGTIFSESMIAADEQIAAAFVLAKKHHNGVIRKVGDGIPYMEHVMEVAYNLWRRGFPPEVVAAGFAHDLREDTKCTPEEISGVCGAEVLRIVEAVTNDASLNGKNNWQAKKDRYIETVRAGGEKAIAVAAADKIANLRSLLEEYKERGDAVWTFFNAGRDQKILFERNFFAMAIEETTNHPGQLELKIIPMLAELSALIGELEDVSA